MHAVHWFNTKTHDMIYQGQIYDFLREGAKPSRVSLKQAIRLLGFEVYQYLRFRSHLVNF